MKFKVDLNQIKTRDIVEITTEGALTPALKLMSRFMVDSDGELIPQEVAYEKLLDTNINELTEIVEAFKDAIVPKATSRQ